MRRTGLLVLVMLLVAGCGTSVAGSATISGPPGRPGPGGGGQPLPLPTVNGGGHDSGGGAPSWVQPGTRITWYQGAASVAQSSYSWVEDPSGPYVDEKTGTHYRRTDESGEGQGAGGGDGVNQLDILGIQGSTVAFQDTLLVLNRETQSWFLGPSESGTAPAAANSAWLDPAQLSGLTQTATGGMLVLKGPYPLNGKTYDSVSVVNPDPSAYSSTTYDTATGLLLASTTSTAGAAQTVAAPGQNPPQGNTELTVTRLVGVRQVALPGLGGTNPSWTANGETLTYAGTWSLVNPVDPSSGAVSAPATMSVRIDAVQGGWASFTSQVSVQSTIASGSSSKGITGPAGLYWIDPAALAKLQAGTTIDTDPITGQVQTVRSADGSSVVLDTELKGVSTITAYDRASGRLVAMSLTQPGSGTSYQFRLQG